MRIQFVFGILWCIVAWQCSTVKRTATQGNLISFHDAHIQYEGRVGMTSDAAELYWSSTTVRIRFEGTGVKVLLKDYNGQNYYAFIKKLRGQYPHTHIICALGSMNTTQEGSKWPGLVRVAVDGLHDKKVYTHFFQYKGTPQHPRVKDNAVMAQSLIAFIEKKIKW